MGYVYSKELGVENDVRLSLDIFKESNSEYRPIVTAATDHDMGFSQRRSFGTEQAALNFFIDNKSALIKEAKQDL